MADSTMSGAGVGDSITTRLSTEGADLLTLAGVADANLLELQKLYPVRVTLRGDAMAIAALLDADGSLHPCRDVRGLRGGRR